MPATGIVPYQNSVYLNMLESTEGKVFSHNQVRTLALPDIFQDQDKPEKQYADAGLDADGIVDTVLKALRHNSAGVVEGARA